MTSDHCPVCGHPQLDNLSSAEEHVQRAHELLDKLEAGIRTGDTDAGWRAGPDAEPPRIGVL